MATTSAQPTSVDYTAYKSVSAKGFDHSNPAWKLYQKAKKLGVWNPNDIDLTQDKEDWKRLNEVEKDYMLQLLSQFQAGEEAVSQDIVPLISVMAQEGRAEDEMYLSTFLFEEVKHTDFFRRFLDEVVELDEDLYSHLTPMYSKIVLEEMPKAMRRLQTDASPEAQVDAAVTYNMIVEGVLAETGYHNFYTVLDEQGILPGLRKGVALIQRDESRHIGYGVYLLARLIKEDPSLLERVQDRMAVFQGLTQQLIEEGAGRYDHLDERPFGLAREFGMDYAMTRYQGRMNVIMRAKGQTKSELDETDYEHVGSLAGSTG